MREKMLENGIELLLAYNCDEIYTQKNFIQPMEKALEEVQDLDKKRILSDKLEEVSLRITCLHFHFYVLRQLLLGKFGPVERDLGSVVMEMSDVIDSVDQEKTNFYDLIKEGKMRIQTRGQKNLERKGR